MRAVTSLIAGSRVFGGRADAFYGVDQFPRDSESKYFLYNGHRANARKLSFDQKIAVSLAYKFSLPAIFTALRKFRVHVDPLRRDCPHHGHITYIFVLHA